ncbi:MAG: hypothetical protein KKG43_06370 [Candidatus Omnitrophica bacterium]|nr:hypothetical protein [Candidatus Omnitrophota bacterium]MBU1929865.1 hypothetical protein [Candidatus Omnitrophota bacterium]
MNKISVFIIVLLFFSIPQLSAEECPDFSDKLRKCEPYKCQFKHPLTGEILERQIVGEVNGRCLYSEQMSNGVEMECSFYQSQREEVAKFFKDTFPKMFSGQFIGGQVSYNLDGKIVSKIILDGKEVEDPLRDALNSGDCVMSGLWSTRQEVEEEFR